MICTNCKQDKDVSLFHKDKKKVNGLTSWCKDCRNNARKEHYWKNPEQVRNKIAEYRKTICKQKLYKSNRNTKLKSTYGLTYDQVEQLKKEQDYKCYICGVEEEIKVKGLVVDHNHTTGKIRKMLCSSCNTALGLVKENTSILIKMLDYIEEHK